MGDRLGQNTAHTSVFGFGLICAHQVFDKMAERKQVLNFGMKFGGVVYHMLKHLWLLGILKWSSFGWFLKKCDLYI